MCVIKPMPCCGATGTLGKHVLVTEIDECDTGCNNCGAVYPGAHVCEDGGDWEDAACVKKIPPLETLDKMIAQQEVKNDKPVTA